MARTHQQIKIINVLLASVDGKLASHRHESSAERREAQFTNRDDFQHMQKITAQCDAIFIGARSIETEIGAFRVAHLRKDHTEPHWFVMTKNKTINMKHSFWSQNDIPKSVFHFTGDKSLTDFLASLKKQNIKKIALLGGGELNGYFWEHNLVSELHLTLSPQIIGCHHAPQLVQTNDVLRAQLKLKHVRKKGDFLFLHYIRK